ncbi:MAG: DUF4124 domain-containing protein [Granulosicoccus sp.]|nr:DUF4124 domain-containing protein [Granulosicoccus sp.]
MLRQAVILILLGVSVLASAEPLYKWVEPDGTITFSPKKPPTGIEYERVDKTLNNSEAGIQRQNSPAANDTLPKVESTPATVDQIEIAPLPAAIEQAPVTGSSGSRPDAISRMAETQDQETPPTYEPPSPSSNSVRRMAASEKRSETVTNSPPVLPARKIRQCQDLLKRVISLERRLKSRLTPEDMDNTVVHMARYQRSYDQHCTQ